MTAVKVESAVSELVMTRTFDASPDQVFDAWCGPQIAEWIGPVGVRAEVTELEPRINGRYRIKMHTPDGTNPIVSGIYREVTRPTKLVFTWTWEQEAQEMIVTLTFRAVGKKTEMTLRQENFASAERREGHTKGWTGSFDKLSEYLSCRVG